MPQSEYLGEVSKLKEKYAARINARALAKTHQKGGKQERDFSKAEREFVKLKRDFTKISTAERQEKRAQQRAERRAKRPWKKGVPLVPAAYLPPPFARANPCARPPD